MIDSPLLLQSTTGTLLAGQGVPKWQTGPRAQHAGTTRPQVSLHNVPLRRSTRRNQSNQKLWAAAAAARHLSPELYSCVPACPGQHTSRYDSSLGLLTKKFCKLVEDADDGVLDLNKAAEALSVSSPTGS